MSRFDTRTPLETLGGALTLVAMAGLTFASAATLATPAAAPAPVIQQLPTVVITGKASVVHQLPTVFITAKRSA